VKVRFNPETDTLTIQFSGEKVVENDEIRPGLIADYAVDGRLIRLEMLDASSQVDRPGDIEFATAPN
jgi:uncharacterized protein YuzE